MTATAADLLLAVELSPDAAGRHDKAAWVGLFTSDGVIEDPVGSRPHRGHDEIGLFYDTFIGPRQITFHRDVDIVFASTVIRDLTLEVQMGGPRGAGDKTGVVMSIPAFLRYDLSGDGGLKITHLRAYWELPAMLAQFARNGAAAVPVSLQLSRALLTNQKLSGAVGFATGLRRAGRAQRQSVLRFTAAVSRDDEVGARRAWAGGTSVSIGDDVAITLGELVGQLRGAKWTKLVTAGQSTAISYERSDLRGVVLIDAANGAHGLNRVRLFRPEISGNGAPSLDDGSYPDQ